MTVPRIGKPFAVLLATLLIAACSSGTPTHGLLKPSGQLPRVQRLDASQVQHFDEVVTAIDEVGFALLSGAPPDENQVTSPLSLAIALSMLGEAMSPDADAELAVLLGAAGQDRTEAVNALSSLVVRYDGDPKKFDAKKPPEVPFVHIANNVVVHEGFPVHNDYLIALHEWYDASSYQADLSGAAGKKVLDDWVKYHTAELIKQSAIEPDPDLQLVLQSAILFGASWAAPFEAAQTFPAEFTTPGGPVQVDTMHATMWLRYAQADGWAAVVLPYTTGFEAVVLLPPLGTDPATISKQTRHDLRDQLANSRTDAVQIALPKLDIASRLDLTDPLRAMGLTLIFDDDTSLPGITDQAVVVGQAVQQGVLVVDEQGTIAAAVTEIGVDTTAEVSSKQFVVDRPFGFVVQETYTGVDLFNAAIHDPRG